MFRTEGALPLPLDRRKLRWDIAEAATVAGDDES